MTSEGELRPVAHVQQKFLALRERFPNVRTVVVAEEQYILETEVPDGITLVRVENLADALGHFGLALDLTKLPQADQAELTQRLDAFENQHVANYSAERWLAHAQVALALAASLSRESRRRKAFMWAALCAAHAGRNHDAQAYLDRVPDDADTGLAPRYRAWLDLARSTVAIDGEDYDRAISMSRRALEQGEESLQGDDRAELLGRIYGTLGRALMHGGHYVEALPWLEKGVEHHCKHLDDDPCEEARSRSYLARGFTKAGTPVKALEQCEQALNALARAQPSANAETTKRYARLERGRALLGLERWAEAAADFEQCGPAARDADYPWLPAMRGLAEAHRRLGNDSLADGFLGRCVAVADDESLSQLLRKVAALAAADGIRLWAEGHRLEESKLRSVLRGAFGTSDVPSIEVCYRACLY